MRMLPGEITYPTTMRGIRTSQPSRRVSRHMLNVVFWGQKDQDVIDVDKDEAVQRVPEHVVHKGLEDGRGAGEAKWHRQVLIVVLNGVFYLSPSLKI